jgi:hypothetical protein
LVDEQLISPQLCCSSLHFSLSCLLHMWLTLLLLLLLLLLL